MEEKKEIVGVFCNEFISDEILAELTEIAESSSISLLVEKKKSEPMATLEWFLPTALIIYFIKPYATAFMQEMGKDNYQSVKRLIIAGARRLVGKDKTIPIRVITSSSAPNKVGGKYSISFSALLKITQKDRIKFLFDDSLTYDELVEHAERIQRFIHETKSEEMIEILKRNGELHVMGTSFFTFNKKTKELVILDPLEDQRKKVEEVSRSNSE